MEYIILIISLVGIVLGADFLVAGAVSIARKFKVSDFVIGAAIVGVGTSMPELVVSFIGALKGNADVAIGNVVGSNIFNVFLVLGLSSIINPLTSYPNIQVDAAMAAGSSLLLLLFILISRKRNINRIEGISMLTIYGIYLAWLLTTL